jgi:hypothetical protein
MSMIVPKSNGAAPGIKHLLATGVGALLLMSSSMAGARERGPAVVIFADADFSGRSEPLDVGDYDSNELGIGNDRISSVHVAPGYRVILFKNSHFSGKTRVLTEDAGQLGNFNDETSSIRVERISRHDDQQPPVVIFSNSNYKGRSQALGPGAYDREDLQIGNNKLSSLRVAPGCQATLFEGEHYSGKSAVVTGDAPSVERFNDSTSSIRVDCRR